MSNPYIPSRSADKGVDGDFTSTGTSTNHYYTGDYWWKVDIGKKVVFNYASIHVRDGTCHPSGILPFDCCKYALLVPLD